jgi:hypothetical protein
VFLRVAEKGAGTQEKIQGLAQCGFRWQKKNKKVDAKMMR